MAKRSVKDLERFNRLFSQYREPLIAFAYSYLKNHEVSEDFVADTFTIFWEKEADLNPHINAPAYLLTILKNKCLNYIEHKQVKLRVEQNLSAQSRWALETRAALLESCEPQELFSQEIQSIIDTTVKKFPPKTKEIFLLSRQDNFSQKEIAEKMHLSVKGVEFHITKALKLLRTALKDYLPLL